MDHFLKEDYHLAKLELFSGEIWGTKFSDEILGIILDTIKKGLKIVEIVIPSNMTFITSEKATENIQSWIDKYKETDAFISFSASIDGLYIEEKSRSYIDTNKNCLRDADYYERLFAFCKKNGYGFHPMVSAFNAKYQIENHKWFLEMMKKY